MRRDQISLQLYTVREETARDMPATLRKISEIGYPAVEFAGYGGLTLLDLKPILDDLGLRTTGVHVPLDSWEKNPEKILADMHTLNMFPRRRALGPARASWGRVLGSHARRRPQSVGRAVPRGEHRFLLPQPRLRVRPAGRGDDVGCARPGDRPGSRRAGARRGA